MLHQEHQCDFTYICFHFLLFDTTLEIFHQVKDLSYFCHIFKDYGTDE